MPSTQGQRTVVTALAVDALGTGVFLPVSLLYFVVTTPLTVAAGRPRAEPLRSAAAPPRARAGLPDRPLRPPRGAAVGERGAGHRVRRLPAGRDPGRPGRGVAAGAGRQHRLLGGLPGPDRVASALRASGSSGSASSGRCATPASPSAACSPGPRSPSAGTGATGRIVVVNGLSCAAHCGAARGGQDLRTVPQQRPRRRPETLGPWRTVLADRPYLGLALVNIGFASSSLRPDGGDAAVGGGEPRACPGGCPGVAFTVNCLLVALAPGTGRCARSPGAPSRVRGLQGACLLWVVSSAVLWSAAVLPEPVAVLPSCWGSSCSPAAS